MRKKLIAFALLGFFGLLNFPFTAAAQPVVASLAATGITATNATLNGTLTTGGLNTLAYFLYGLTPSYDSYGATTNLAATNTTLSVSNLIGGLSPGTTYHFLLVATNSAGIGSGMDLTFTTLPLPPVVATLAATGITSESAILNGTVNPGGAASGATFQFGVTTNYGSLGTTVFQAA